MLSIKPLDKKELGNNQAFFYNSNFMQSKFWAELKSDYGFKPLYFLLDNSKSIEVLSVLIRPIVGNYSIAYIPHGPSEEFINNIKISEMSKELKKYLPKGCLLIRFDLLVTKDCEIDLTSLKKSAVDIQVPDTTILDIDKPEEDLLKNMHKKTRYNIKLAKKKAVVISEVDSTSIDRWYDMYKVTAKRDSIAIHSKDYYKSVYSKAKKSENSDMRLLFAEHEGDLLAGIFVLISGNKATYLYGASSNNKRNLMPSYLLQWSAIKLAKSLGATEYDFFGIPPSGDKGHPMHGLYRFKTGFGGRIVNRVGCYDYPLMLLSIPFRLLEVLRNYYYKKLKKA